MLSLDLPPETIAAMRTMARDATIEAARAFGFGGEAWAVSVPSGSGVGPKTLVASDAIQALAFRQRPGYLGPAAGDTPVLGDIWRMIVVSGSVTPGAVVTSVEDARYRFGIASTEPWYDDYIRCELERIR